MTTLRTWLPDDHFIDREATPEDLARHGIRAWVGLTDEEVVALYDFAYANDEEFVRNVEAKLKQKNT